MKPPVFKTSVAWDTTADRQVPVIKYNFRSTPNAPGITYQIVHIPPQWCIGRLP